MDAQYSRTGSRQYRLQRQWKPTHEQSHGYATGDGTAVTGKPRAWNSVDNVASKLVHTDSSGQLKRQINRAVGEFSIQRFYRRSL